MFVLDGLHPAICYKIIQAKGADPLLLLSLNSEVSKKIMPLPCYFVEEKPPSWHALR
jgi:hypothetical protein